MCTWRRVKLSAAAASPLDARKPGEGAAVKHCCAQVLCYRKGSDCCNLCTGHLYKPISSGFLEEKSMSPSHVEDNHPVHKLSKSTALQSSCCALSISMKPQTRANVYKIPSSSPLKECRPATSKEPVYPCSMCTGGE